MTALADENNVLIDGVYYNLCNYWSYSYYDDNGNWQGSQSFNNVAVVTYDPNTDVTNPGSVDTYSEDLQIPDKVTYNDVEYSVAAVSDYAFANCRSLTSVQLPSSVVFIGNFAFRDCTSLNSVTMPGIECLGNSCCSPRNVFEGSALTTINLPASLKTIQYEVFNASNLTSITIDTDNQTYTSIDGVLYDKDVTKIVGFPGKKGGTYKIPATITAIKSYSFPENTELDELIIPATVTRFESNAFYGSPKIKKLTIEDSESEITFGRGNANYLGMYDEYGNYQEGSSTFRTIEELYWGRNIKFSTYSPAFAGSPLKKIEIGEKVTKIQKYTFYGCNPPTTLDIKGGFAQWCLLDFSEQDTDPMRGSTTTQVLFNGAVLSGDFVVPDGITTIPAHGFQYSCSGITDLTIPASVTSIADGAFKTLSSLATIQLATGNTSFIVEDNVLYNKEVTKILCFPQLRAGDYTMPTTITEMGDYQFYNCINLTGVTLPNTIKAIPLYSFANCTKLATITMPASVETIGNHAFTNCSSLANLTIPASVETIGNHAFDGCSLLTTLTFEDNSKLKTIGSYAFANCTKLAAITIPASVEAIDDYAFNDCSLLTTLTIEDNSKLKTIGNYAFANCTKLATITIPASVETIYDHAFDNCSALAKLTIEDSDNTLKLGKGYTEVKYETWTDCRTIGIWGTSPIKEVYIGRNLELLDGHKYNYYNNNLSPFKESSLSIVNIGNKVNKIPAGLFNYCWNIREVNFDGTIIDWCNITFADQYSTPFGAHMSGPSPILNVKEGPLHSKVNIPEGATKVGAYAFYGMNGVTSVDVPSTVKTIEPYAFAGVKDIYIHATNVINLEDINSFTDYVYVADNAVQDYKNAPVWSDMKDRIYPLGFLNVVVNLIAMGTSPALLPALNALEEVNGEYRIEALTNLKIRGTMNGWDFMMIRNKMPNLRYLDLSEAEILTNDGEVEYYQGYHTKLNTITPYTFYNLQNLKQVILPEGIEAIEERAFSGSGITSMVINEGIKTIGYDAFSNCHSLTDLTLGKGLETIESNAFQYCSSLKKLYLPTTLKRIESYAFESCTSLTDIDFAEGLTDIEYGAFQYCSSLQDVHLPTSLKRINGSAFQYCNNLNEVHVPSMLEEIGDNAFTGCGLSAVYAYTVTPIQINQNTFDYKGVQLYVPDNSFYAYYMNTQWSQFLRVNELKEGYNYTAWYTARNTDIEISTDKPIRGDEATGWMYPGSGLIITGNGEQLVKKLILEWKHGYNYPSLIENGNLNVDELAFIMNVYPRKWYFFCFPCDIKIQDLKFGGSGKYVWRYYDSEARATGGSGWKNVTGDVLKAGVGYIYQCNVEGTIELPSYNPEYLTQAGDKEVSLETEEAANPQDASWNFVGNPNLSYYSLDEMAEDFDSPITVWNDENQTYEAVVPGDDDYTLHPFQAFFVQKPTDSNEVAFRADKRETYNQSAKKAAARSMARALKPVDENHLIVNIEISDGKTTDKTRVVFDDRKSMDYEAGIDASKFMSMAEVPQVYTLDYKNVKYAINTRPISNNEVRLGFKAPVEGTYTINASHMDMRMALKDKTTGTIHDFSNGEYTFLAEAGSNDNRFALVPAYGATGISENGIEGLDITAENGGISVNGINGQTVNIYNVKGVRVASLIASGNVSLPAGTYIVSTGNKTSKILVK